MLDLNCGMFSADKNQNLVRGNMKIKNRLRTAFHEFIMMFKEEKVKPIIGINYWR